MTHSHAGAPTAKRREHQFAGYLIEERLGAGGMAEVVLARTPAGARVALKRMLPDAASGTQSRRVFRDEARLGLRLRHRCIASVLSAGEDEGVPFLTMEWIDGADLQLLLRRQRASGRSMPASLVLTLAGDLASALEYAHALEIDGRHARIVHRDVSPANVLVSRRGEVKLADFGIARASIHQHRTQSGFVKGKLRYMPPEQALGAAIDRRCDLFSLGVVLYECLAGFRPYEGRSDLDSVERAKTGSHVPLARAAPDAPAELRAAIERLIRPERRERFASAGAFLDALCCLDAPGDAERERLGALVAAARGSATRKDHASRCATESGSRGATGPARPGAFPPATPRASGLAPRPRMAALRSEVRVGPPRSPREFRTPAERPSKRRAKRVEHPAPSKPVQISAADSAASPRVVAPIAAGAAIGLGLGLAIGATGLLTTFTLLLP